MRETESNLSLGSSLLETGGLGSFHSPSPPAFPVRTRAFTHLMSHGRGHEMKRILAQPSLASKTPKSFRIS
jgi:hypothetical protein